MDNVDFAQKRILLASLLPDTGHLTPLLQIAAALKERDAEVLAVVPIEAENVVRKFSVNAKYLGPVIPGTAKIALSRYSEAGELSRLLYWGPVFNQNYIVPLIANGVGRFDELVNEALKYSPHLIITDNHLFSEWYKELAHLCNCQLILNYSKGSHYYCQDERVWSEGRSLLNLKLRAWLRSVAVPMHYYLGRIFFRERLRERISLERIIVGSRAQFKHRTQAKNRVWSIAAGTAGIERRYLGDRINLLPSETRIYGPIDPGNSWGTDEDLRKWLDSARGTPVVYVAFGTMVTPSETMLENLVNTLVKRGARVLIATRECPGFLVDDEKKDVVLWKSWVPQCAVLSHPSVVAFASHVGATSVSETLWYGKPILCLPVLWDQFYFSWVAEQLGFGIWADGTGSKRLPLEKRVERLLADHSLRERAEQLSGELRGQAGLDTIIRDIHYLLCGDIGVHK